MNIKQAAQLSGVSPQNIRYYEREGLLCPQRDPNNAYRQYSQRDLHTLKLIRMLRMLDMPLNDIRSVLEGREALPQVLENQEQRLQAQAKKLQAAIHFCQELKASAPEVGQLDVDACLACMERPTQAGGFFAGWVQDYKRVAAAQHQETFTFVPDGPVTNPREFTDALLAWSREAGKDIVITRESMYPRFTLEGREYEAHRIYRRMGYRYVSAPLAIVRCRLCGTGDGAESVAPVRRRVFRLLRCALPALFLFGMLLLLSFRWLFAPEQSLGDSLLRVAAVIAMAVLCGLGGWFHYFNHFNDQTR